ncbi:DNA-binding protein [Sphingomonas sp. 35-24ZXX]|uniref:DNA-binding protein n=1 Tax=Sphingomonas sp. 35-24ZXX TaxID=1545915 RepID=UPI00053BED16|nr:DNA-binding protein [Sphingomonas sp. 35-24ZXX]
MGRITFGAVTFDDVYNAVQLLLDGGYEIGDISLRKIREVMGDRGSLATIAKHLERIKVRKDRGEAFDGTELSKTDVEELCAAVDAIVYRRTFVSQCEAAEHKRVVAELVTKHEAELETKAEIVDDLEEQVFALESECGNLKMGVDCLERQIAQFEGTVEALQQVIATLAPKPGENAPPASMVGHAAMQQDQPSAVPVDQPSVDRAETQVRGCHNDQTGVVRKEQG